MKSNFFLDANLQLSGKLIETEPVLSRIFRLTTLLLWGMAASDAETPAMLWRWPGWPLLLIWVLDPGKVETGNTWSRPPTAYDFLGKLVWAIGHCNARR